MPRRRAPVFLAAVLAIAFAAPDRGPAESDAERFERAEREAPGDWFIAQRAFPFGRVPQEKYRAAVARAIADRARMSRQGFSALAPGPLTWTQGGPFNIGGRVTAIAAPAGGATVYLGSANGGVFKSTNSGVNWTPVFDATGVYSIGAVALDPADPQKVYVGTGEANASVDSYDGSGVFASTDGGTTWASLGLETTARIGRIAVDPSDPQRLFVAAMGTQFSTGPDRGLYRSENGGTSWTKVLFVSDSTGACDVVVHPTHPETVYCATWERVRHQTYRRAYGLECGIWRSADHGTTWTRLSTGLPTPSDDVGRIGLAIAKSNPTTIYAQIVTGTSLGYRGLGVYRSVDGGQSWTRRDPPGGIFEGAFGGFCWYFGDMAVDPTNANRIYCLGQSLLRSVDGGANFTNITFAPAHVDFHAFWIDPLNPLHVYAGSDGGFFWSSDLGNSWSESDDLPISQFYAGAIHPTSPNILLGGTQDNGSLKTPTGSPTNWLAMGIGGDGFYVAVDPVNGAHFAEWQFCSEGSGVKRSTNGGNSFGSPTGFNGGDRYNWCTPFVIHPSNHNLLLAGSQRVYRSTNNGVNYGTISPDLTTNPVSLLVYGTISTLDISPADTNVYYAGTDDGKVWRTINRGGLWTDVSAGLPVRSVTRVTADPLDPQVVYVTLSGFGSDESLAHVYRSGDRGDSWTSISSNLPDVPANDLLVDPASTKTLYLATDVGVYWTRNGGGSWTPLGWGMPVQTVFDLSFHAGTRKLVAATHGRSQWILDLSQVPLATEEEPAVPALALSAPTPNPARGAVRFSLELPQASATHVAIYDAAGRRVRNVWSGPLPAGTTSLAWDGRDAAGRESPAGIYFARASAGAAISSQRIVRTH